MARFSSPFRREQIAIRRLRGKRQRRAFIEPLESRLVMTASATLTAAGAVQFVGQGSDSVDLTYNSGTHTYTIVDNSAITVTNNSGGVLNSSGSGTDTITVSQGTGSVSSLTFNDNSTGNTFNIESTGAPTTVQNTSNVTGTDTVNVGSLTAHTVAGILGALTVSYVGRPTADVTIDDSGDTAPTSPVITSSGIMGLAPQAIDTTGPSIASLTINGGSGGNVFDVNGDLPGASTTINAGAGNDLVSVLGTGLATGVPTTTLTINGQTGNDTLRVNASGTTANVGTAGTVTFGGVGGASFTYTGFSSIQNLEDNHAPVITPAGSIVATANVPLNGVTVATFTDSDTIEIASSYVATINWGDGNTSPGTIVATSTPGSFTITGSHTFTGVGPYSVAVTLTDQGGTFNTNVGGIPVATILPALSPQTGASVSVTPGALTAGTTTPVTATTGTALSNVTLATFSNGTTTLPAGSYTATIDWGDGTPASIGTISLSGTTYTVKGSHDYAQPGSDSIQILINGDSQQITESTTATVTNPTLTANYIVVGETAGTASGALTLAGLSGTPSPDSTAYTATIDWGDGSTTTAATISDLSINTSGHTYGQVGAYNQTVTLRDTAGFVLGTLITRYVVAGLTVTPSTSIAPAAGIETGPLTVATLTSIPSATPDSYTAVVAWGDGATTDATVVSSASTLDIPTGGHTYAQGGTYGLGISLYDAQGYLVGSGNTSVAVGVTLTGGRLSPQTDTGISQNDTITNNDTPTFVGNVNPGTTVEVFATATGSASLPGTLIASGVGSGSGVWTATNYSTLANGIYGVTAEAINTSTGAVLATESLGNLTVDTVGPVVTNVSFNRFDATATITLQDNLSGLDYASITNSAFYQLSARPISSKVHVPRVILPTSITVTPGATPTSPETVSVTFYRGRELRGGLFTLTIDSGNNDNGLQDVAGNALDGNFYGTYPSGDGLPGGNFVALIPAFHNKLLPAEPILNGYVPPVNTPGTQPTSTLGAAGNVSSARRAALDVKAGQRSSELATQTHRTQVVVSTSKPTVHDLALKSLFSDQAS